MELLGDILLALLIALGVFIGLLLVMPLSVQARGAVSASALTATYGLKVRWAFGVLGLDLDPAGQVFRLFGFKVWRSNISKEPKKKDPRKRARKVRKVRRARKGKRSRNNGPLWFWQHRDELLQTLLRLLSTLHLRGRVEGLVGLEEPDDTIWLALAIHAVSDRLPEGTLALDVDYADLALEVEGRISAWAVPLHVAAVGLALITFDRTTRHAVFGAPAQKIPLTGELS